METIASLVDLATVLHLCNDLQQRKKVRQAHRVVGRLMESLERVHLSLDWRPDTQEWVIRDELLYNREKERSCFCP